jgi:hypothetical protein
VRAGGVPTSSSEVSVRVDARGSSSRPAFPADADPTPATPAGEVTTLPGLENALVLVAH